METGDFFGAGADGQRAAAVHGVFGINRQVDDDLRKLNGVYADVAEVCAVMKLQADFFSENPFQHLAQFHEVFGDVDQFGLQRLLAGKCQQLAHQTGGAVGVVFNLNKVSKRGVADAVALQQQVAETDDRGQEVVKVVGDAAGQLSHRLHFLRLGEFDFEVFLFGSVDQIDDETGRRFAAVKAFHRRNVGKGNLRPFDQRQLHGSGFLDAASDVVQFYAETVTV